MNILLAISDSYVPYTAAMLQSMADSNPELSLDIYIISPDISKENKDKLEKSFNSKTNRPTTDRITRIIFPDISHSIRDEINNIAPHLEKSFNTSYILRLFAPRILPNDIHKILYLDVDTVISSSLKELEEKELDEKTALAAVKDLVRPNDYERLGIDQRIHTYFNSGVMLLNFDFWRKHNIGDKCLQLLEEHSGKFRFPDQDALNVACQGHTEYLHPKYNCITFFFARREFLKARIREEEFDRVQEAAEQPAIVHFTWPSKPWHKGGFVPKRELWQTALAKTEWRNTPIVWENGIKGQIKHILKSIASIL